MDFIFVNLCECYSPFGKEAGLAGLSNKGFSFLRIPVKFRESHLCQGTCEPTTRRFQRDMLTKNQYSPTTRPPLLPSSILASCLLSELPALSLSLMASLASLLPTPSGVPTSFKTASRGACHIRFWKVQCRSDIGARRGSRQPQLAQLATILSNPRQERADGLTGITRRLHLQ